MIEEETERLAGELKEVLTHTYVCPCACPLHWSCRCPRFLAFDLVFHSQVLKNRNSLRTQLIQLRQYRAILTLTQSLTESQVQCECGCDVFSFGSIVSVCVCFQFARTLPPSLDTMECGQDMHLRLVHFPLFLYLSVWALYKSVLCLACSQLCCGCDPFVESVGLWAAPVESLSRIHHCWFPRDGGKAGDTRDGRADSTVSVWFHRASLSHLSDTKGLVLTSSSNPRVNWWSGRSSSYHTGGPPLVTESRKSVTG